VSKAGGRPKKRWKRSSSARVGSLVRGLRAMRNAAEEFRRGLGGRKYTRVYHDGSMRDNILASTTKAELAYYEQQLAKNAAKISSGTRRKCERALAARRAVIEGAA
jgi:hypothetical protein